VVSSTSETIQQRCTAVHAGLGEAVEWVTDVRRTAPRLDRDADGLIEKLRRSRNLCRRLGAAARRPLAIGVFGMSQAGKSYLISSLARAAHGELFTELDGHRLNFIGHINPPGGGKEATGLVTRFTRQRPHTPDGYPVELTLFSETDLVKILGNSFFNDFDRERVTVKSDPDDIRQHLAPFEAQRQARPVGSLDEDAMVDLMDYFAKRYAKSMEPLAADFWPTVIDLAPRLPAAQRAALLSPLWGEVEDFTRVYVQLRAALERLGDARHVYVPLDALVVATAGGFHWNQDSIVNVDVLNRLGKDQAAPVTVLPMVDGRPLPPTPIARSLLTALTAEMTFVLADPPVAAMLEQVDLLDFPGYRGRLSVANLDEVRKELKRDDADPVAQLLLRGKVAYLFERYTDDQEMNVLMMCTRCDQQIEITTLAPVLNTWVHATQGETPAARAGRRPGLLWVLTQLDRRLDPKPGQTETQQRQEWSNMIHITLLERFAQCEWLHDWADSRPFDNVFLVRKPGFLRSVIETDADNTERGLIAGEAERLDAARAMFVADDNVVHHVVDPGAAWDAVLTLNDGGMERLARHLGEVAVAATKLTRIDEQVQHAAKEIAEHRLGPYYFAEGVGELARKQALAARVRQAVRAHPDRFGELLHHLQPPAEPLRQSYLRGDAAQATAGDGGATPSAEAEPVRSSLVRLPDGPEGGEPEASGRAVLFARTVMSTWIKQLRDLPDNLDQHRHLGLGPEVLRAVTDELVSGADRTRLEQRLVDALSPLEAVRSTTRARIADQQVLLARAVVNAFVDALGIDATPPAERPASAIPGRPIFTPPPPIPPGTLPELPPTEMPYSGIYVLDWLEAFARLATGNAGHAAGREITPEQNRRLGEILAAIQQGT